MLRGTACDVSNTQRGECICGGPGVVRAIRRSTVLQALVISVCAFQLSACNQSASNGGSAANLSGPSATPTVKVVSAVDFSARSYTTAQNGGSASVTISRIGDANSAISVDYATSDGSATAGSNYTSKSGTLHWAAGDASTQTIAIPVNAGAPFSGAKQFYLTLTNPSNGTSIDSPGLASVSISGASSPAAVGSLSLADASYVIPQGQKSLIVTVNRSGGTSGAVSVAYSTLDGTAAAGTDYTAATGELNWADGDGSSKSFTVPISSEGPFSGSKTFSVSISSPTGGATISSQSSASVSIVGSNSSAEGAVELGSDSYPVAQNVGSVNVSVDRTGGSSGVVSVDYATSDGSAVAGTDYTASRGTLQWADGDTSPKTISVPIAETTPFSGTKAFSIALSNPSVGASIAYPGAATVTISGGAGAAPGTLELSAASYNVSQSAGRTTISVTRTGGSTGPVSVSYATSDGTAIAGTDYTATSGTLSWSDGDTATKTFSVPISNGAAISGTKSFKVTLSNAMGGATLGSPSTSTVTINGSTTAWVYYNGVFNWPGDWSWNATPNYQDTAGGPIEGPYDIAVTITGPWGGWQPYAPGNTLDTTLYKYIIFSIKATQANQWWSVFFHSAGDTPDGNSVNASTYGPSGASVVGQWVTYKIPLSAFGLTDTNVLKFAIADGTGVNSNLFYVDNVGFTTN